MGWRKAVETKESRVSTLIMYGHAYMIMDVSTTIHPRDVLPDLTRQGQGYRKGTYS
jgi:hypothetical protein